VFSGQTFRADIAENGAYMGFPCRRSYWWEQAFCTASLMRWAAGLAFPSFLLAMGPLLKVDGSVTGIKLPFAILSQVSLFQTPSRRA
jgi:hypothetical protein